MLIDNITFTPRTGGEYATRGELEVTYEFEHTPQYKTELVAASEDMTTDSVRFSDMRIAEPCTTQVVAPEAYWMLPSCKNYNTAWDVKVHVRPVNTPDFVPSLGGKTFTAKVAGSDMFWEPGYAYTYVFMLKDDGIEYISKIQMGITEWDVRTADRHDFYTW